MYLTSAEYATLTGDAAPSDFAACLSLAEALIDGPTLQYYAQVSDLTMLPALIQRALKSATAYQVQAISQMGGIAGATEPQTGASVGRFTAPATTRELCTPTEALLPLLVSYARGAM